MSLLDEQRVFYRERVPEHFNQTFERQRELAESEGDAQRLFEEMRAVGALIRVEVDTEEAAGDVPVVHLLEIESGRMRAVETAEAKPFFVLRHRLDQFRNLRRECGESVLGFLGALAGLPDDMMLTRQRVRSLRELDGQLAFEVEGDEGFRLTAAFGDSATEANAPTASIRLRPEIFSALQSGALEAQDAFFDEKVDVEGDMGLAIGAALAALSPE